MIGAMAEELPGRLRAEVRLSDFGSWMASEQRRIFLLCRRMLQDAGEADSATQDIFLKAFKAMKNSAFEADDAEGQTRWLTRIAVNTCLDYLRSTSWKFWRSRPASKDEELILQLTVSREPDAEKQIFAKQIHQRLERALEKLTARQRAVFCLRHYEGLALEQIATALTLDQGTVKVHLFRAITKLREELKDLYQAGQRQAAGSLRSEV